MTTLHWLQLAMTDGVGPVTARRLLDATAGDVEAACGLSVARLRRIEGVGPTRAATIHASMQTSLAAAELELERAGGLGVRIICREDDVWPELLDSIPDPPLVLYVKGVLESRDLNALAIVGSRRCTFYGREQAERFAALLAGAGFTVVSGGARGIDSSAHRGALSHPDGRTVAVLGSGVDVPYPPENAKLFDQIAERGAVLSEYPLGTQPLAEHFPRRNRIVSGMSRGVLVVEADQRSGALITAKQAIEEHNRPVFALPGRVDSPQSSGPHQLIRDGAALVTGLEDILEGLGPLSNAPLSVSAAPTLFSSAPAPLAAGASSAPPAVVLSGHQDLVFQQLTRDGRSVDQIIESSGLEAAQVLQELTFLSLKGLVRRVDGNTYALQ